MNWPMLLKALGHAAASAVIAAGTAITVLQAWPTKYQWLIITAGGAVAGAKDALAYLQEAK